MHAVLAGLICTSNKNERIAIHDSFPSPFTARIMLWTVIRSFAGRLLKSLHHCSIDVLTRY